MKLHYCCGATYLDGYINIDVVGQLVSESTPEQIEANRTTLDKYFKYPFNPDHAQRQLNKRPFILDRKESILDRWNFDDDSVDEVLLISAWEHFHRITEIPHIVSEAYRVLRKGGQFKFDYPHIKAVVDQYYYDNPEFMYELIYCNQKDPLSIHRWGYNSITIGSYLGDRWSNIMAPTTIVAHDYPMQGVIATK